MANAAIASFNKTVQKCPHCGDSTPKEIVNNPEKKTNWGMVFVLMCITFGVGLLFTSLWRSEVGLVAHCGNCQKTFGIKNI